MQEPYQPFENDRLNWASLSSEVAQPLVSSPSPERLARTPLAVLVLIGAGDAENCCAANYERTVFKDQTVVGLAQSQFVTIRIDRGQADVALLRRLGLARGKPALVVLDVLGEVAGRWQDCVNARDVAKVMKATLKARKKQTKAATEMEERLGQVRAYLSDERFLDASRELVRLQDLRYAPERGKALATSMLAELAADGRARMQDALEDSDAAAGYDELLTLRSEMLLVPGDLIDDLRREVGLIEADEANAQLVARVRGQRLLDEANALLERETSRARAKARGLLRQIRRDYPGTPAAEAAEAELAR